VKHLDSTRPGGLCSMELTCLMYNFYHKITKEGGLCLCFFQISFSRDERFNYYKNW